MTTKNEDTFQYLQESSHAMINKALELMALISAGSFAVVISLGKGEPSTYMKVALSSMIVNILSVVYNHFSIAKLYRTLLTDFVNDPGNFIVREPTTFGKLTLHFAWISFTITYGILLVSILV